MVAHLAAGAVVGLGVVSSMPLLNTPLTPH